MKKSELNNYIRKYILPTHQDYYVDEYVMYKTFGNDFFMKGYLFYSKGDKEMGLKATYFVKPLYVKNDRIACAISKEILCIKKVRLFNKVKDVWWDARKEYQSNTFQQISLAIQDQGEPILNKINDPEIFYEVLKSEKKDNIRVYEEVAYSTILFGEIQLQDKMLIGLIKEAENERDIDWVHQIKADAQLLLNIKNTEERITVLKSWANETIGHLKLPKLKPFAL